MSHQKSCYDELESCYDKVKSCYVINEKMINTLYMIASGVNVTDND